MLKVKNPFNNIKLIKIYYNGALNVFYNKQISEQ